MNWNALAGFLRHLPWDSVRVEVEEPTVRGDQRIMAWLAPHGRRTFVVTNRANSAYTYTITAGEGVFAGSRYTHNTNAASLGDKTGPTLTLTVPAYSIGFWTEKVN